MSSNIGMRDFFLSSIFIQLQDRVLVDYVIPV